MVMRRWVGVLCWCRGVRTSCSFHFDTSLAVFAAGPLSFSSLSLLCLLRRLRRSFTPLWCGPRSSCSFTYDNILRQTVEFKTNMLSTLVRCGSSLLLTTGWCADLLSSTLVCGCSHRIFFSPVSVVGHSNECGLCVESSAHTAPRLSFLVSTTWVLVFAMHQGASNKGVHFFIWTTWTVCFTLLAVSVGHLITPFADGSGVPQLKAILGGVQLRKFFGWRVMMAKLIGLFAGQAAGLPIGKEVQQCSSLSHSSFIFPLLVPPASVERCHHHTPTRTHPHSRC